MMKLATRAAVFLATILAGATAAAQDAPAAATGPVVLLVPVEEPERLAPLQSALEAHLSGFAGGVEAHEIGALPDAFTAQAEVARTTARARAATAVVWIDETHAMVFVLVVAAGASGWIMQRPLPGAAEGWQPHADGIASMVYSALTPWVDRPPAAKDEPTVTEPPRPAAPATDDESPFDPEEDVELEPLPRQIVSLLLRAGYGPIFVNNTGGIQHGGRVGVGLLLLEHLELGLGLDLLVPLPAEAGGLDREIELVRWPLRLNVGGYVSYKRLDAGLKLELVVDFTSVRGVNPEETRDDPEQVNPGFSSAVYLRMRLLDWLALWVEGGFDLYGATYDYTLEQYGTILRYGGVQGRLSGGVAVLFGLR